MIYPGVKILVNLYPASKSDWKIPILDGRIKKIIDSIIIKYEIFLKNSSVLIILFSEVFSTTMFTNIIDIKAKVLFASQKCGKELKFKSNNLWTSKIVAK